MDGKHGLSQAVWLKRWKQTEMWFLRRMLNISWTAHIKNQ